MLWFCCTCFTRLEMKFLLLQFSIPLILAFPRNDLRLCLLFDWWAALRWMFILLRLAVVCMDWEHSKRCFGWLLFRSCHRPVLLRRIENLQWKCLCRSVWFACSYEYFQTTAIHSNAQLLTHVLYSTRDSEEQDLGSVVFLKRCKKYWLWSAACFRGFSMFLKEATAGSWSLMRRLLLRKT